MEPIRPVGPELRPVPPVRRRARDEDAERREQERRRGRHDPAETPRDSRTDDDGGGDGPLVDVRV